MCSNIHSYNDASFLVRSICKYALIDIRIQFIKHVVNKYLKRFNFIVSVAAFTLRFLFRASNSVLRRQGTESSVKTANEEYLCVKERRTLSKLDVAGVGSLWHESVFNLSSTSLPNDNEVSSSEQQDRGTFHSFFLFQAFTSSFCQSAPFSTPQHSSYMIK